MNFYLIFTSFYLDEECEDAKELYSTSLKKTTKSKIEKKFFLAKIRISCKNCVENSVFEAFIIITILISSVVLVKIIKY